MAKINELREKRAKIWEQAKVFLDSHRNETGILSAEDTAVYEKMEKDIVDLGHEIERQQRADEFEREFNLSDGFDMHCDNMPTFDRQEVRISIFSKGNYSTLKYKLVTALFQSDISITDRLYIGYESDTGYHNYAIDALKTYELEEIDYGNNRT